MTNEIFFQKGRKTDELSDEVADYLVKNGFAVEVEPEPNEDPPTKEPEPGEDGAPGDTATPDDAADGASEVGVEPEPAAVPEEAPTESNKAAKPKPSTGRKRRRTTQAS